jgi:hypothetical protein
MELAGELEQSLVELYMYATISAKGAKELKKSRPNIYL